MAIETRKARVRREASEMHLKPWQLSPSQVTDDDPSPWPPGTAGYDACHEAQAWRNEIRTKDPHYFDVEDDPAYWDDDEQEPTK